MIIRLGRLKVITKAVEANVLQDGDGNQDRIGRTGSVDCDELVDHGASTMFQLLSACPDSLPSVLLETSRHGLVIRPFLRYPPPDDKATEGIESVH